MRGQAPPQIGVPASMLGLELDDRPTCIDLIKQKIFFVQAQNCRPKPTLVNFTCKAYILQRRSIQEHIHVFSRQCEVEKKRSGVLFLNSVLNCLQA